MKDNISIEALFKLSNVIGVGGCEDKVVEVLNQELHMLAKRDRLGNALYSVGEKTGMHIVMAMHMDEVGYRIKEITDSGFVTLHSVGNIWNHNLLNQELWLETQNGDRILGLVVTPPSHSLTMDEKKQVLSQDKIFVDVGMDSRDEVLGLGLRIGDSVVFNTRACMFNSEDRIMGKAMDDRCSLAVGMEIIRNYKQKGTNHYLTLAASVQEEVGLRGARTIAHVCEPDLAIVLDTTISKTPLNSSPIHLGSGVVISVIDSMTIMNKGLLIYLEELCKKHNIKFQYGLFTDGGTDAGNIHKSGTGIPTINISIPVRYMHTHASIVDRKDLEQAYKLIECIIEDIDYNKLEQVLAQNYIYEEE